MFRDILRESLIYQEILEEGAEQERARRIQEQREMLLNIVQLRYPELLELAKQQAESIKDAETLPSVNLKLIAAQSSEDAKRTLQNLSREGNQH